MNRTRFWPLAILTLLTVLSVGALSFAARIGDPGKPPPPKAPPKPTDFPLSLFIGATDDDYISEKRCVNCHPVHADGLSNSAHASYAAVRRVDRADLDDDAERQPRGTARSNFGPARLTLARIAISSPF